MQNKKSIFLIAFLIIILSTIFTWGLDVNHSSNPYSQYAEQKLTVSGDGLTKPSDYTVKEIEDMEEGFYTGTYTMRTLVEPHTNKYTGIRLDYLLKLAGITNEAKSATITAFDGVSMTFEIEELTSLNYINENGGKQLPVIIGFSKDSIPLVPGKVSMGYDKEVDNSGGPMRLVIGQTVSGERNSPKWLQNIATIKVSTKDSTLSFSDLGNFYSWAQEGIYSLAGNGIINGVGEGKFAPEKNVTRAEFTKMLLGSLGLEKTNSVNITFSDVKSSDWYAQYINAAVNAGLIQGIGNGKFNPNGFIDRNEIACLMIKAMAIRGTPTGDYLKDITYKDKEKIPIWALPSVAICEKKGLFNNIAVGYFNGTIKIQRAEAAVLIYRMLNL